MEDASLEEPAFAIRNSMKLLTDALIAPLVDWETPQQVNVEYSQVLPTAIPEVSFN